MQCPACKASIDDDSFHCDQCGVELLVCTQCGHFGKGKRCPADGTALVARKTLATTPVAAAAAAPAASAPTAPAIAATGPRRLRLTAAGHGVSLQPVSGTILGRRFGPHADVLGRFSQISSNHLEVRQDAQGQWHAKDLNSFNHSFLNGQQLAPQVEHRLDDGANLTLGDVPFKVTLE